MYRQLLIVAPFLFTAFPSEAQAPSPAQVGLTTVDPNAVQIRDSSGTWVTIGTIDPATHLFFPASGIDAGLTTTSGFTAGQLLKSDGTYVQPVGNNCTLWTTNPNYPAYLCGYSSYPSSIYITSLPGGVPTGIGFNVINYSNSGGITINDGTRTDGYYGFIHSTNDISGPDTQLVSPAAGIMSQAFSISPQTFRVQNTYTDASNGEWGALDWQIVPDTLTIGTEANGTGTQRPVNIVGNPVTINGAAVPDGSITAGTTPTNGFTAGQLVASDGSKTQVGGVNNWIDMSTDARYPIFMSGYSSNPSVVQFTSANGAGRPYYGAGIGGWLNGSGILTLDNAVPGSAWMGFASYTNSVTAGPDAGFMSSGYGILDVIPVSAGTQFRVDNIWTDPSNNEWGGFDWATTPNTLTISTGANGTGTFRNMRIGGLNVPDLYLQSGNAVMDMAASGWVALGGSWNASSAAFYFNNISVSGSITVGSSVGVSCAAGTVSLTTLVVTQGIITHC